VLALLLHGCEDDSIQALPTKLHVSSLVDITSEGTVLPMKPLEQRIPAADTPAS